MSDSSSDVVESSGTPAGDDPTPTPPTPADEDRDPPQRRWTRADWYACAALMVLALSFVALHVRAYETISPIDEMQHLDYMIKAGDLEVPRVGEQVSQEVMTELACRRVDHPAYRAPACVDAPFDPLDFPEYGVNTAANQLPAYYFMTAYGAKAIDAVGLADWPVDAGRLVGGLWLGAGFCVLWYLLAVFGIPRLQSSILLALIAGTPLLVFHSATINADAALLLTGALTLLATVKFEQRRLHVVWLLATYAGVLVIEQTNMLAVAVGCAYLALRLTPLRSESVVRRVTPVVLLVCSVVALDALDRFQDWAFPVTTRVRLPGPRPGYVGREIEGVDINRVLDQVGSVLTPILNTYVPEILRNAYMLRLIELTNWLLLGLMFAAALVYVRQRRTAILSGLGILAMMAAGPFYTWYYASNSNVDFDAPGRFGLPLLAIVIVAAASAVRTRPALIVSGGLAVVSLSATSLMLLRAAQ